MSLTALPAPASLRRTHPADGQRPDAPSAATPLQATPDAKLMSISFRGCTTERAYPQPVSYVHDGDTLLTPAGGKWKLNHRRSADPTVVHGPQDLGATRVRRGCRRGRTAPPLMTTCNPRTTSFVPVINPEVTSTKAKWRRRSPTHRRRHTLPEKDPVASSAKESPDPCSAAKHGRSPRSRGGRGAGQVVSGRGGLVGVPRVMRGGWSGRRARFDVDAGFKRKRCVILSNALSRSWLAGAGSSASLVEPRGQGCEHCGEQGGRVEHP